MHRLPSEIDRLATTLDLREIAAFFALENKEGALYDAVMNDEAHAIAEAFAADVEAGRA